MAISVREYLEDKNKLELNYLTYGKKMDLVDIILENVINRETRPATINTAVLKNIAVQTFIQNITNIDLSEELNNGENGYDILCYTNSLNELLMTIKTEYDVLEEMLNDRINDFYRFEYSLAKTLYDIEIEVASTLSSGADYLEDALKNLDVERIVNMMPKS